MRQDVWRCVRQVFGDGILDKDTLSKVMLQGTVEVTSRRGGKRNPGH